MNKTNSTLSNSLLVFVAGSSYGFIVPIIKTASENGVFPEDFLPVQYLIALVACAGFMFARKIPWGRAKATLPLAVLGLFTGATSICYYTAVSLLPSSAALTLLFQYVWVSVLIECIRERHLPSMSSVVSIVIVLIGTVFATGIFDGSVGALDPIGVAFGFGSAVFYALFLYFSGVVGADRNVALRATMLALGGLVVTSIFSPLAYASAMTEPMVWPCSLALAVLGIMLPTTIINYASPKLSAGMVSIMASSELPVGVLAAWAFVGDTPSPLVLLGCALVLAGIACKQAPTFIASKGAK